MSRRRTSSAETPANVPGHSHDTDLPHATAPETAHDHERRGGHGHDHGALSTKSSAGHGHGHSNGMIDPSITPPREGLRTVLSLGVLLVTALIQLAVLAATGSVALLADLIHNGGDALTAIPLGAAFLMRSRLAEKRAGYFVVAMIFVSAAVAAVESVDRLLHPQQVDHLWALAGAGGSGSWATRSPRRSACAPDGGCTAPR